MIEFLEKVNKYCLYILVFSVTFENWDPFGIGTSISITYMATILYILSWVPFLRSNLNFSKLKPYLVPLILFILVGIVSTAINSGYAKNLLETISLRVIQLIFLMVLIAAHISKDKALLSGALNSFVASVVLMYLLQLAGIGATYKVGRLFLFGENPNVLGMKATMSFLILVSKMINGRLTIVKILVGPAVAFALLNLLILSGSRGALLSLFLGLIILVVYIKMNYVKKVALAVLGVFFALYLFQFIMTTDPEFRQRIERSISQGDTGRNKLWNAAFRVIEDNYVFGVGLPGVLPEMLKYSGKYIEPHSVFLYVFMSTGIIGFIFYMVFILRLGIGLFKKFRQTGAVLFLVIFTVVLLNMAKAGGGIGIIFFWLFFGMLIGYLLLEQNNENKEISSLEQ